MALCTANFESGINGNTIAASDSGSATAWDIVELNGQIIKYDNAHARNALAAKFDLAPAAQAQLKWTTSFGAQTNHYGRIYLYMTANSVSEFRGPIALLNGGSIVARIRVNHNNFVQVYDNAVMAYAMTVPIAFNQWIRIEWHLVHNIGTGSFDVRLWNDAIAVGAPTDAITASGIDMGAQADSLCFGTESGGPALTFWADSIVAADSGFPGPDVTANANTIFHAGRGSAW